MDKLDFAKDKLLIFGLEFIKTSDAGIRYTDHRHLHILYGTTMFSIYLYQNPDPEDDQPRYNIAVIGPTISSVGDVDIDFKEYNDIIPNLKDSVGKFLKANQLHLDSINGIFNEKA